MRLPILATTILALLATFAARPAHAQPYWTSYAAADSTDSTRAVFRDPPMPLVEAVFYWPVRVVTIPVVLLADGLGETVEFLDDSKVLDHAGKLLRPRTGPVGVVPIIQAGGLGGFGGGLMLEHDAFLHEGNQLRLRASATVNGDSRLSLGMRVPLSNEGYFEFGAGYRNRANARYFGIGPDTKEEDESFYRQEVGWTGAALRHSLIGRMSWEADALYSTIAAGEPREDATPSISTVFAGALPFGFGERSYGVSAGLQLIHENEAGVGRTTRGGSRRVRVERFESTDGRGLGFWSYRTELQQFLTLWHPYRVLAIRGFGSWLDPTGSDSIPFQRLMVNDTPDLLRGNRAFRFRDRGMLAFNAEYRFPIFMKQDLGQAGADLYPLVDWGQVFDDANEINLDRMEFSYGVGLRIESGRGFVARIEWAKSPDEATVVLRMDQLFQFTKQGFLFGRDPIPSR
jgi:hypothetical protein